jgi:hypothetical protein
VDSALSVIQGTISRLGAITDLTAIIGERIYTDVPQKATFPYVQLSVDSQPFAASDFSGQAHTLRIQAFSQEASAKQVLEIRKLCLDALDRQEAEISLPSGSLVQCQYLGSDTPFQEDDGKTWQAVGELEVIVV